MRYKTIVIDPPWKLGNQGSGNGMNLKFPKRISYSTMTDEEISALPISDFTDQDCGLFMWCVLGKIPSGLKIMESWGFKYHVMLTWLKPNTLNFLGFGRKSEAVLFGFKGRFNVDTSEGHYIPTVFYGKNHKHSEKPSEFYEILRERTPEPRLDMFARKRHFGFDSWGNQVESDIEIPLTEIETV